MHMHIDLTRHRDDQMLVVFWVELHSARLHEAARVGSHFVDVVYGDHHFNGVTVANPQSIGLQEMRIHDEAGQEAEHPHQAPNTDDEQWPTDPGHGTR